MSSCVTQSTVHGAVSMKVVGSKLDIDISYTLYYVLMIDQSVLRLNQYAPLLV